MARGDRFEVVGFDADDTLWRSEESFRDAEEMYAELVGPYAPDGIDVLDALHATERDNIAVSGYGVKAFMLSVVQAAVTVTGGTVPSSVIGELVDHAHEMLMQPVELLPGVPETLAAVGRTHRLVLITKGDLVHQVRKVRTSGLDHHFEHIEIVLDKDVDTYGRVLTEWGIDPATFLMIGNSVRSDILPIVELGGHGVHVPYHVTWEHEVVRDHGGGFAELATIAELPAWLAADRPMPGAPDVGPWDGVAIEGPCGGGNRNVVWAGRRDDEPVAIRRSRRSAASLAWELDVLRMLDERGFRVPVALPTADGRPSANGVVVQRWLDGRRPASEADWALVAGELERLHASCRDVAQRPGCLVVTELDLSSRSVDADLAALPDEVADRLLVEFRSVTGVDVGLVHGDPGASNIRIDAHGRVGLLDWDESRVDVVWHDLSNLGIQVLSDDQHARAQRLSDAWEAANAWLVEPDYARRRWAAFRGDDFRACGG